MAFLSFYHYLSIYRADIFANVVRSKDWITVHIQSVRGESQCLLRKSQKNGENESEDSGQWLEVNYMLMRADTVFVMFVDR